VDCKKNYLKIETSNHDFKIPMSQTDYYDDDLNDNSGSKQSSDFHLYLEDEILMNNKPVLLTKLCSSDDLRNNVRFLLIKSASNQPLPININDPDDNTKTNIIITQYTEQNAPLVSSELFDLKISYEFINFDWNTYQMHSVCDFIYNINSKKSAIPNVGYIQNPQASIFYKLDDDFLRCRYRIIGKTNQYIKLTIESIDFELEKNDKLSNSKCDNIYFSNSNVSSGFGRDDEKCNRLNKKLIIKEFNDPPTDMFKDNESHHTDFDNTYNPNGMRTHPRMCLCQTNKKFKQIYISKYDVVDIEYIVKLKDENFKMESSFKIKYEFKDRNCNKILQTKAEKAGKIVFKKKSYGIQTELNDYFHLNDTNSFKNALPQMYSSEYNILSDNEKLVYLEKEYLLRVLKDNLNFHCKFYLKPKKNHRYVYIEFDNLYLANFCRKNFVRISTTIHQQSLTQDNRLPYMKEKPYFVKLCALDNINDPSFKTDATRIDLSSHNMVVAQFMNERSIDSSLSCYNAKKIACFMTSDFVNKSSTNLLNDGIVIEILSDNLGDEFFFAMKYHFYGLLEDADSFNDNNQHKKMETKQDLLSKFDFKCPRALNGRKKNVTIFLDNTLLCDKEVHCIFSQADELNCKLIIFNKKFFVFFFFNFNDNNKKGPLRIHAKIFAIVLGTVFSGTFIILFLFYIIRRHICVNHKSIKTFHSGSTSSGYSTGNNNNTLKHIEYMPALDSDNYVIEN
jgi:hypothetical protein